MTPTWTGKPARAPRGSAAGFTLVELLLVMAILAVGMALLLPVLASARRAAYRTTCTANLRQLGMAYQMYVADWGSYPLPAVLTNSPAYVPDGRLLRCPEDTSLTRASSSYIFAYKVPPYAVPLAGQPEIDPNVVLASCHSHLGNHLVIEPGDNTHMTAPDYPYFLLLRAGGWVERIRSDRMRRLPIGVPGSRHWLEIYPGEPGYDTAEE